MKDCTFTVLDNTELAQNTYRMRLLGDTSEIRTPGQFVNLKIDGLYLRRPISVCDCRKDELTLIYKVVGKGTEAMREMEPGTELDILTGLGNGFDVTASGDFPLLIGGGVGVPPLYWLAKELLKEGKTVSVILGFNKEDEIFGVKEFEALGCSVTVATADGSSGIKGFVTDALPESYSTFFCCGPEPMLKAVYKATKTTGQLSFAERMGCGFGACMGCTCETLAGPKRICKDGPVMRKEEIKWAD